MKNSSDSIGNRTPALPAGNAVQQPIAPPLAGNFEANRCFRATLCPLLSTFRLNRLESGFNFSTPSNTEVF